MTSIEVSHYITDVYFDFSILLRTCSFKEKEIVKNAVIVENLKMIEEYENRAYD